MMKICFFSLKSLIIGREKEKKIDLMFTEDDCILFCKVLAQLSVEGTITILISFENVWKLLTNIAEYDCNFLAFLLQAETTTLNNFNDTWENFPLNLKENMNEFCNFLRHRLNWIENWIEVKVATCLMIENKPRIISINFLFTSS